MFAMRERAMLSSVAVVLAAALAFGPAAAGACALLCGEVGNRENDSASVHSGHSGHSGHTGHSGRGQTSRPDDDRAAAPRSGRASVGVGATAVGCCDHPGTREARPSEAVVAESLTADPRAAKGSLPVAPAPRDGAFRSHSGAAPPGSGRAAAPGLPRTVVLRL